MPVLTFEPMKTVILAGGLGTRLSEETTVRPKPMVEIGGRPMLWHIMSIYGGHGYDEFVIACGYKGEIIKQYFGDFFHHHSDWTVDLRSGERTVVDQNTPDWRVHLVDTGARHHDRRAGSSTAARPAARRPVHADLRRRPRRHRHHRARRLPPIAREARHRHRGAPPGPVRCDRARR